MRTVTFDGSKIYSVNRDESGQVNIYVCDNDVGVKAGQIRTVTADEALTANCFVKLEMPNEATYINLCRALLSYATRAELMSIIGNPLSWTAYTVKERKRRKDDEIRKNDGKRKNVRHERA